MDIKDSKINPPQRVEKFFNNINKNSLPNKIIFSSNDEDKLNEWAFKMTETIKNKDILKLQKETNVNNIDKHFADVFVLGDFVKTIKKEDLVFIKKMSEMSSLEDSSEKIFLIKGLEFLTNSASNVLLKILDDSKNNNFFIMLCLNISGVLETIKSRCIKLEDYFNLDYKEIKIESKLAFRFIELLKNSNYKEIVKLKKEIIENKAFNINLFVRSLTLNINFLEPKQKLRFIEIIKPLIRLTKINTTLNNTINYLIVNCGGLIWNQF